MLEGVHILCKNKQRVYRPKIVWLLSTDSSESTGSDNCSSGNGDNESNSNGNTEGGNSKSGGDSNNNGDNSNDNSDNSNDGLNSSSVTLLNIYIWTFAMSIIYLFEVDNQFIF